MFYNYLLNALYNTMIYILVLGPNPIYIYTLTFGNGLNTTIYIIWYWALILFYTMSVGRDWGC
jgi:hypothetical protein